MPDRADQRCHTRGCGAHKAFIAEGEQVLKVAAAAGDDDHVDLGISVETRDGAGDLADGAIALHSGVNDPKVDGRPAQLGVANDVFLGVGIFSGHEADAVRQKRQPLLAGGVEQTLARKLFAQPFEPFQQVAEPDVAHFEGLHGERAALDPEVGLDQRDDAVTRLEVGGEFGAHRRPDRETHGGIFGEVLELAVDIAAAGTPLGDLTFHPDHAETFDIAANLTRQQGDRPRRFDGGGGIRHAAVLGVGLAWGTGWSSQSSSVVRA